MFRKSLTELSTRLKSGAISSVELTQYFLDRIAKYDGQLNSYISVNEEFALDAARLADKLIKKGGHHPLTGIPISQKDIFCTSGIKTSCGSKMLDNFIAPYNATVVEKFNQCGMVTLGKTNMDEFAMGSSNETSFYGKVLNPWDTNCIPGGSSGGSAAAIAAGLTPAATGTDTGGSIRQPASHCGISGIKPTYGRVSRYGMVAFASSLDQGGPMAKSAEDLALLLGVMAGFDERDSTSIDHPVPDYSAGLNEPIAGLKVGIPEEYFAEGLDNEVAQVIETAIKQLQDLGMEPVSIQLPNTEMAVPTYYVVAPAECSSNLARFDGVRYGHRCDNPKNIDDLYERSRAEGFGDEVKRRIMIGTYVLSAGYYDAYYLKAQKVRKLISNDFKAAFEKVDLILGPTSPEPAFELGAKSNDPVAMYLADIYTIAVNLAGLPALSIPAGFSHGKPVGLQLIGNYFEESRLLQVAHQYQLATDWHQQIPQGFAD